MKFRVVVVGVIEKNDMILIGRKAPNVGPYPNTWHIPGGGVDLSQESAQEALIREIREESNILLQNIGSVGFDEDQTEDKHKEMVHYLFLDFTARYSSGELRPGDDMHELLWIEKVRLKSLSLNKPTRKLLTKLSMI